MCIRSLVVRVLVGVVLAVGLLSPRTALAHKPSDAYVSLTIAGSVVHARVDVALRDLEPVLGLDADRDGAIRYRELVAREGALQSYLAERFHVGTPDGTCAASASDGPLALVGHTDGTYAVVRLEIQCARPVSALTLDYRLFFDRDALHRGLVRVTTDGEAHTEIMTAERTQATFRAEGAAASSFGAAVREGITHIAQGADHLLFVLALLLPAVLRRAGGRAEPATSFRAALGDVARIVTAFTVAHSLTLTLAALELVRLPSRLVETAIAVSVVVAAIDNVRPFLGEARWLTAFALGLLHGFGFSAVLVNLGLAPGELAKTLVGFNLGVENGQLVFVALVFPLAYALRRWRAYVPVVLWGGSAVIALVASAWVVERAFDLRLL